MTNVLISGSTHPGKRRKENQDAFIAQPLWSADKSLLSVIDGVGGYAGGEKAAGIARECIIQYMQSPSGDTLTMLREAVVFANNRIVEERELDLRIAEMCCVLTAVVADITVQRIYFAHVGDTRLYRFRNGLLQKLTRDHSFVGIREDAGELSEAEAMEHPHRNQILREVGTAIHRLDDTDFMDYGQEEFLPGDMFLLCSDGLTDMISSREIVSVLSSSQDFPEKISKLIEMANVAGGHDNITVVLLQHPIANTAVKDNILPIKKEEPLPVPAKKISASHSYLKRLASPFLLSLLFISVAGWYFATPLKKPVIPASLPVAAKDTSHSTTASREIHTAIDGPLEELQTDTIHISSTQNYADLKRYTDSTGRAVFLMPAKTNHKHFPAITINNRSAKAGDTLHINRLRLSGFETGIEIQIPILLKTDDLVVENTTYPFRYPFKPNETQTSILFMNTGK